MRVSKRNLLTTTALLAATIASADLGVVMAQSNAIDEVLVTARKREETLLEVPSSGTVLTREALDMMLKDNGIEDFVRLIPGALNVTAGPAFNNDIGIRGQGAGRTDFTESATGLYRNGIHVAGGQFGGRTYTRMDFFDLERFEAFRGPQGALFGRNAVGGAVNIISRKPGDEFGGFFTTNYEIERSQIRLQGALDLPIVEGKLKARAAGFWIDSDGGLIFDSASGRDVDTTEEFGARLTIEATPTDNSRFSIMFENHESEDPSFDALVFRQGFDSQKYIRDGVNAPSMVKIFSKNLFVDGTIDTDIGTIQMAGVYKWRDGKRFDDLDHFLGIGSGFLANSTADVMGEFDKGGFEIRLESNDRTPEHIQWLIGADYQTSEQTDFRINVLGPAIIPRTTTDDFTTETTSYSGFGLLGFDLTDQLNLTGEIRVTHNKFEGDFFRGGNMAPFLPAPVMLSAPNQEITETKANPVVTLTYRPADNRTLYARIATAFRPSGFTPQVANPADPITFEAEDVISYELGYKANMFDGKFGFDADVFYTTQSDVQVVLTSLSVSGGNIVVIQNQGDGFSYGAELQIYTNFEVGPGNLNSTLGLSHIDGEFDGGAFDGNRLPRTRDYTLNLSALYTVPIPNTDHSFFVHANLASEAGGYENPANTQELKHFDLIDGRFGIRNERWTASFFVQNATNEIFIKEDLSGALFLNRPRTWGGEVTLRF